MGAITDADGHVAQVSEDGRLFVLVDGTMTATDVYVKRSDGTRIDPATEGTLALVATEATLALVATEATLAAVEASLDTERAFVRALKFEPKPGEEIRRDETDTDDYHGVAPDGSLTSDAVWTVVRFYKTSGKITRARYRTGVAWDNRTAGWS